MGMKKLEKIIMTNFIGYLGRSIRKKEQNNYGVLEVYIRNSNSFNQRNIHLLTFRNLAVLPCIRNSRSGVRRSYWTLRGP